MLGTLDKVTETIYVLLMIKSIQRLATAVKGCSQLFQLEMALFGN